MRKYHGHRATVVRAAGTTWLAAVLLLVSLCFLAHAGEEEAKRSFLEGWYLETVERKAEEAIQAYRRAIDAGGSPREIAVARLRVGVCLRILGKEDDARAAFEEVLRLHGAEADLAARARRYLEGKDDATVARLGIADPRLEVLSLVDDMKTEDSGMVDRNVARFLGVLRLSSPEYVRDVVLPKDPDFGRRAQTAVERYRWGDDRKLLPPADPEHVLTFAGIPELRDAIYLYLRLKGDVSIVPRLVEQLESVDPDLRAHAAATLAELRAKESAPRILSLLEAEDGRDRARRLALALGTLRHAPAIEDVMAKFASGTLTAQTVSVVLSRIATPVALGVLEPLLLSDELEVLSGAWQALEAPSDDVLRRDLILLGLDSGELLPRFYALMRLLEWQPMPIDDAVLEKLPAVLLEEVRRAGREEVSAALAEVDRSAWSLLTGTTTLGLSGATVPQWIATVLRSLRGTADPDERPLRALATVFRPLLDSPLREEALEFFLEHPDALGDFMEVLRSDRDDLRALATSLVFRPAGGFVERDVRISRSMSRSRSGRSRPPAQRRSALWMRIATDPAVAFDVKVAAIECSPFPNSLWKDLQPVLVALLSDRDSNVVLACLDRIRSTLNGPAGPWSEEQLAACRDRVRALLDPSGDRPAPTDVRRAALECLAELEDFEGCLVALHDANPRVRLQAARILRNVDGAYDRAVEANDLLLQRYLLGRLKERFATFHRLVSERRTGANAPAPGEIGPATEERDAWLRRLGSLLESEGDGIRLGALKLLEEASNRRGFVPARPGTALALRVLEAAKDVATRRAAFQVLDYLDRWAELARFWDELRESHPSIAFSAADKTGRKDLMRSLREHPDPEIRSEASWWLFQRSDPSEARDFLADPHSRVRAAAVKRLQERHDLAGIAPALADEDTAVAKEAFDALRAFSESVGAVLVALGAKDGAFDELSASRRKEISASLLRWLEEQGDALWMGRAEGVLRRAAFVREHPVFSQRRLGPDDQRLRRELSDQYRSLRDEATRIVVSNLPSPAAVRFLLENEHVSEDEAAEAFAEHGLVEPLRKIYERQRAEGEGAVSESVLHGLVDLGLRKELREHVEALATPRGEELHVERWSYVEAVVALWRAGEKEIALEHFERLVEEHGFDEVTIETSTELGPRGPLVFLGPLATRPGRTEAASLVVAALRRSGSAEGLERALVELPEPPVEAIFDGLLELGKPDRLLQEALDGEFWYEAAIALRRVTGEWHGYFGTTYTSVSPPEKTGFLTVSVPRGGGPSPARASHVVSPAARRAAVNAWRKSLGGGAAVEPALPRSSRQ